ncbi:MAG: cupin domain-containing protein [Mesorhizobium sp.]|nr:MAG: cupin domain-containing protein [Mesorhizobium sp.]
MQTLGVAIRGTDQIRTEQQAHPLGQTLIVTAGKGLVQQWREPIEEIEPGDVVWIPPGVKHWHGASPTAGMTHVAVAEATLRCRGLGRGKRF